jgi:hypothetical protein
LKMSLSPPRRGGRRSFQKPKFFLLSPSLWFWLAQREGASCPYALRGPSAPKPPLFPKLRYPKKLCFFGRNGGEGVRPPRGQSSVS